MRLLLALAFVLLDLYGAGYAITLWARHHYDDAAWWSGGAVILGRQLWRDRRRFAPHSKPSR